MRPAQAHEKLAAVLLSVVCAQAACTAAYAGLVKVDVTTRSGAAAEDAVIVFDPLDGMPAAGHDAATIDQINKRFVPRVTVVRTGTSVTFPNSDQIRHQVYSFSHPKTFTLKLYAGSPQTPVVFDRPGLVVLGCNIHDRMVAFVGVVDSPYFAKTTAAGTATLTVPAGRYRMWTWHPDEVAAVAPREITVTPGPMGIPLSMDIDSASAAVAAWPE